MALTCRRPDVAVSTVERCRRAGAGARSRRGAEFDAPTGGGGPVVTALLAVVSFVVLFPIYTTVIAALQAGATRSSTTRSCPTPFTFDVIVDAWTTGHLGRYLFNSFVVAVIVTVAQVTSAVLAAYAFAFLDFPGRERVLRAVPRHAAGAARGDARGQLRHRRRARLVELLPGPGRAVPRDGVRHVPAAPGVPDAAARSARRGAIDGVGHLGFLWYVAVPLVRPTLGALALFGFLGAWNQYLWPNLIINETDMNTVQIGLRVLSKSNLDQPNLVMAGTVIAAVPIVIVLLVFQRQLVRGLTAGAVKG